MKNGDLSSFLPSYLEKAPSFDMINVVLDIH